MEKSHWRASKQVAEVWAILVWSLASTLKLEEENEYDPIVCNTLSLEYLAPSREAFLVGISTEFNQLDTCWSEYKNSLYEFATLLSTLKISSIW